LVKTGKDRELLTPFLGCLQSLSLLAAAVSAGGVLVAVLFLCLTVSVSQDQVAPWDHRGKFQRLKVLPTEGREGRGQSLGGQDSYRYTLDNGRVFVIKDYN
jgi:hypothetical protein